MLTVFRSDFPGGRGPAADSVAVRVGMVGTLEAEFVWPLVGRCGEETALLLLLLARAGSSEPDGCRRAGAPPFETRDFATGSEGSGPVGGAIDGRDGRGSVWLVILVSFVFVRGELRRSSWTRRDDAQSRPLICRPTAHSYPACLLFPGRRGFRRVNAWKACALQYCLESTTSWCHSGGEVPGSRCRHCWGRVNSRKRRVVAAGTRVRAAKLHVALRVAAGQASRHRRRV